MQMVTCTGPVAEAQDLAEPSLTLGWASTDYGVHEPDGAAVLLDVVVRNRTDEATESTSLSWDGTFGSAFAFLASDPPAWRVTTDEESGWVVLDTDGVLAREDGSFRVWFSRVDGVELSEKDEAPRIRVVADGGRIVGKETATAVHASERVRRSSQLVFERGRAAAIADHVGFLPAAASAVFGPAVGLATLLLIVSGAGLAAAFRLTGQEAASA